MLKVIKNLIHKILFLLPYVCIQWINFGIKYFNNKKKITKFLLKEKSQEETGTYKNIFRLFMTEKLILSRL